MTHSPRVLIIVQNLPVPFDRRVWLECQTLRDAGYDVTVVCPRGKDTGRFQVVDGVTIHGYRPYAPGGSALGYVLEYAYSFLATARLALKARRSGRFDVIQACNPPDIFWPLARWFRMRDGSRFVFDHHDLCPELFESRFPGGSPLALKGLKLLERATFRTADRVTSTNESYRGIALKRGDKAPHEVSVVRTGPDPEVMKPGAPVPSERRGRDHLVAYLGVMGPQDGVDVALAAADHIVHTLGRTDISFTLMGGGDSHADLVAERDRLGLQDFVELPGRVPDAYVADVLSTAHVGLSPDPLNPLNNVSTMNKTMEYMAFGLPVVAFDLVETRVSAGDAAVYADPASGAKGFAEALVGLLDDPASLTLMGKLGRERVESQLAWEHQAPAYLAVFDELTGSSRPSDLRRKDAR
ncbi:MAG TPA: glycosyltransferase family 4 protein [Nocardioides sp.]|uniref:glycosyltransferase family 4 protein n=1 Tax=Nocardioides sp. TaxID=35761 RepID=UPI002E2F1B1A|nr:glycosyltransferase family 4 protein [Nocardioides sp.]HEX5089032.1 glycosyltransferase family 4 protein [Nocardioides sp.]